jgi:hypothetical protein
MTSAIEKTEHIWAECEKKDCPGCMLCDGGLAVCKTCGLMEGALTTDCCGYQCFGEMSEAVYTGKSDFIASRGGWIGAVSPHCPSSLAAALEAAQLQRQKIGGI